MMFRIEHARYVTERSRNSDFMFVRAQTNGNNRTLYIAYSNSEKENIAPPKTYRQRLPD